MAAMRKIPSSLKTVITTFALLSLCIAVFDKLAFALFSGTSLSAFFGLSLVGLEHYYLWQPLTYFLIEPSIDGLSLSFLVNLFFDCYMLWMIGSSIIAKTSQRAFVTLLLFSGFVSAGFGIFALSLFNSQNVIIGVTPVLFALLISWLMHFPSFDFLLFFTMRLKAKWCVFALIGIGLLSMLSEGRFIDFAVSLVGAMIGYLYTTFTFGLFSPFLATRPLDKFLAKCGHWCQRRSKPEVLHGKIIDIRSLED